MPATARLELPRPRGARLRAIVRSHGWSSLPPYSVEEKPRLRLRGALPASALVPEPTSFAISEERSAFVVELTSARRLSAPARLAIATQISELLSLDEHLGGLYALTDPHERLSYARRTGAGRMLRGASVWEDLVKVLLTTNCSWALTTKMSERLTAELGAPAPCGRRAFPTPAQMAAVDETYYREVIRAGYRAPHLVALSRAVHEGRLALPRRADPAVDDETVRRALLELPGFGPYAADNLLRLLGRFGYLGLDSWCRASLAEIYGSRVQKAIDRAAHRRYSGFGRYAGLAMWLDVTRRWHVGD